MWVCTDLHLSLGRPDWVHSHLKAEFRLGGWVVLVVGEIVLVGVNKLAVGGVATGKEDGATFAIAAELAPVARTDGRTDEFKFFSSFVL